MSDADFLNMPVPDGTTPDTTVADTTTTTTTAEEQAGAGGEGTELETEQPTQAELDAAKDGEEEHKTPEELAADAAAAKSVVKDPAVDPQKDGKPAATTTAPATAEAGKPGGQEVTKPGAAVAAAPLGSVDANGVVDYEASFKEIMKPFKANGKMIEPRSVAEAVQLMQMGANYTRKMQDIQPHRKMLLMLENNGLLDEAKLSFLIDLEKKNPEAIRKLVKDAGIDPMEMDVSAESTYQEGNHRVTDEEAGFRTVLNELTTSDDGKATLVDINTRWDQASKEVLWKTPEIMTLIHEQRSNGMYDRIVAEVEHQRTIGQIPPNTPFLSAYKKAGDELTAKGGFNDLPAFKSTVAASPAVVGTTVAKPKGAALPNGAAASAASPTRSSPRKAAVLVNPLAMSDDEFLKSMDQRV
jgi:hypothetical protein